MSAAATFFLRRKSRQAPHLRVLKERFIAALITTLVVAFFGVIFVNNDQTVPPISLEATKVITRLAMLGLGVIPAVGWLWTNRKP